MGVAGFEEYLETKTIRRTCLRFRDGRKSDLLNHD